jgi:hypothetical protein
MTIVISRSPLGAGIDLPGIPAERERNMRTETKVEAGQAVEFEFAHTIPAGKITITKTEDGRLEIDFPCDRAITANRIYVQLMDDGAISVRTHNYEIHTLFT